VALHASDAFWDGLAERIPPVDACPVPAEELAAVRDALPSMLLEVHVALARELRGPAPGPAGEHVALIRDSGFPAEAVERARAALVAGLDGRVAAAIRQRRFGPVFDEVAEWLQLDPAGPAPARLLVVLATEWAWTLLDRDDGWLLVRNLLRRVDEVLRPEAFESVPADDRARLLHWRGAQLLYPEWPPRITDDPAEIHRIERVNQLAERYFRDALALSPGMRLPPWEVDKDIAKCLARQAECAHLTGRDAEARTLLGQAVALDPGCAWAAELIDVLGAPDPPTRDVRDDVAEIAHLVAAARTMEAIELLERLERTRAVDRQGLAEHPAVARLAAAVRAHPLRRRRVDAVLERLRAAAEPDPFVPARTGDEVPFDNPWRWHPDADPYRDSAFGVLGVRPTTVLRRAHAVARRSRARFGEVRHLGRVVDEAAINAAEQRLRDPVGRVLETLRVHAIREPR